MRLLRCHYPSQPTSLYTFSLIEHDPQHLPQYAILSHRWGPDEALFKDVEYGTVATKLGGYRKLKFCADQAVRDGLVYFWVDTCCIDKTSSTELSEAINSMYKWYEKATKCYVYLSDVSAKQEQEQEWEAAFRKSEWFNRGWTLQELIAPRVVEFFSKDGEKIGDKQTLEQEICQTTKIPASALRGKALSQFGIEERLSWAARRETTREEDIAYCLLGIFNVFMPPIYGEGRGNAMTRLRSFFHNLQSEECKCQQLLKTSDYELHKETIPERHSETCRWAIDSALFQHWCQEQGLSVLLVTADPGCGKTVLAKALVDNDLCNDRVTSKCYFFFKRGVQEQESLANALSAILHQLFRSQPLLLRHAVAEWAQVGDRLPRETYALWRVLQSISVDTEARPITCIVDALDECQERDRQQFVELLGKLSIDTRGHEHNSKVKFLVTSRPDSELQALFRRCTDSALIAWLRGEYEHDKLRQEVDIVITGDVDCWEAEFGLSESHKKLLLLRLSQLKQRTYLWWALVRHNIYQKYNNEWDANDVVVDDLVHMLPSSLERMYEDILDKLPTHAFSKARIIYSIMLAAQRPLHVAELARLSTILGQLNMTDFPKIGNDESKLTELLRKWCGSFVFIYHSKLYFFHPTAREFLAQRCDRDKQIGTRGLMYSSKLCDAHEILAIASYIELQHYQNTSAKSSTVPRINAGCQQDDQAFVQYAATHVMHHVAEALRSSSENQGRGVLVRFSSFGVDLKTVDTDGRGLLHHLVIYEGSKNVSAMVEKVLQAGGLISTADCNNMHVLQYAVRRGNTDIITSLLRHKFPVNEPVRRKLIRPIPTVCKVRHRRTRQNKPDILSLTAVDAAVLYGRFNELTLLVKAGADLKARSLHTALALSLPGLQMWDAWEEDEQMVEHVWDFDDEDEWNDTLLRANKVRIEILSLLCQRYPTFVQCQDEQGRTGLHLVRYDERCYCAESVVTLLLRNGADPTVRDAAGVTPAHLAAERGNVKCFQLLVAVASTNIFALTDDKGRNCLHYAAKASDQHTVEYILADTVGMALVHTLDIYGQSPLHICLFDMARSSHARLTHSPTVDALLQAGAQASSKTCFGRDALAHYLIAEPFLMNHTIVSMLLKYGADASFQESGSNLAHILVRGWNEVSIEALEILRCYGVSLTAVDDKGRNILHCAAIAGTISEEFLAYLHNFTDQAAKDCYEKTALMYAQEKAQRKLHPNMYRPNRWKAAITCLERKRIPGMN